MNVVLSALIIILLLYPGIFFRAVYFRGNRLDGTYKIKYNVLRQPIWEQVIASIVPAFLIHIVCTQAIDRVCLFPNSVDYGFIYDCLLGRPINAINDAGNPVGRQVPLSNYLGGFFLYLISSLVLALISASVARDVVFRNKLDSRIPLLRFSNEWFYWLTGRVLETNPDTANRTTDFISVHVLAETKENTIIYDGVLYDFTLSETHNGLDRIVLSFASKSVFQKVMTSQKVVQTADTENEMVESVKQSEQFEQVDRRELEQEFLIIPYSQIKNITISYIDLQE